MSIAISNRISELEKRLASLEDALNILLHSPSREINLEEVPVIVKIKNDLQGIKMRMGKQ